MFQVKMHKHSRFRRFVCSFNAFLFLRVLQTRWSPSSRCSASDGSLFFRSYTRRYSYSVFSIFSRCSFSSFSLVLHLFLQTVYFIGFCFSLRSSLSFLNLYVMRCTVTISWMCIVQFNRLQNKKQE